MSTKPIWMTRRWWQRRFAPRLSKDRLASDLHALGMRTGGTALVHSSLSALGNVVGGPGTVIEALVEVLGREGTLVMPTHSWEWMDQGCRTFDVQNTKSCVGAISEAFRLWPGVRRSLHPTHSLAALGPRAEELLDGHNTCVTPCGRGTPYQKLLEWNGQIAFLGASLSTNTSYYTVEEIAQMSYLLQDAPEKYTVIDADGRKFEVPVYRYRRGFPRRFGSVEGVLVDVGVVRLGRVGSATSRLLNGATFRDFMVRKLAEDPTFLLADQHAVAGDNANIPRVERTPLHPAGHGVNG